jgi:hypothetical protein
MDGEVTVAQDGAWHARRVDVHVHAEMLSGPCEESERLGRAGRRRRRAPGRGHRRAAPYVGLGLRIGRARA